MLKKICIITLILFGLSATSNVYAGIYTDDLSRCIAETTTEQDRIEFVKWMFVAMSKHPAVKSFGSVSETQMNDANKKTAELFMKILTDTCKEKAKKAIKYEGAIAMQASFQILGQIAAQELFGNPDVAAVMSGLEKYIDTNELEQSLGLNQ